MGFNKKHWLFHLAAIRAVLYLAPANCGHARVDKKALPIADVATTSRGFFI